MRDLQRDGAFWKLLEQGAVDRAMDQPSFAAIIEDDALRGRLAAIGAVSPEAALDPEVFRAAASSALVDAAPRIRALRSSPALQSLKDDPEVAAMLQRIESVSIEHDRIILKPRAAKQQPEVEATDTNGDQAPSNESTESTDTIESEEPAGADEASSDDPEAAEAA